MEDSTGTSGSDHPFGFFGGSNAGIFSVYALNEPLFDVEGIGFRCGR